MAFPPPSISPPTLANFQYQFNGVTLGGGFSPTAAYGVTTVTGLSMPAVRQSDQGRPRDQGELIGLDVYGGRDITLTMQVKPDASSLQHALVALSGAFAVSDSTEVPFWVQLPNLPLLVCMARPRKYDATVDALYASSGFANAVQAQVHATDPRAYGATQTASVGLNPPTGGLTFPATPPFVFGSGASGSLNVTNGGNFEMRPVLVITGPCTNPAVQNSSIAGGPTLTFSNPAQITTTLNAGDTLTVDLDLHTVIYTPNGAASGTSVRNWLTGASTWWNLPPGANNIRYSSADASATASTLTVQWANAYASFT